MSNSVFIIISLFAGLIVGALGLNIFIKIQNKKKKANAEAEAQRIIAKAKSEAARLDTEAKNRARDFENRARRNAEQDIQKQKQTLSRQEQQFKDKESMYDRRLKELDQKFEDKDREIKDRMAKISIAEGKVKEVSHKVEENLEQLKAKLESVSSMTKDQAKQQLIEAVTSEAKTDAAKQLISIEEEAKSEAEAKAKRIISMAIARFTGETVAERSVSIVALPNEEVKGKIIGREGRNIRALEAECGVDLIIDDTPEAVVISAFDPVRREIARLSLERLIEDGRVHPSRIEEIVAKSKKDIFKTIKEDGDKAILELGLTDMHPEILKLVGSLKYRYSYNQNNYYHSIEAAHIAGLMATELGVDAKLAKRATLLHDIGKALDHSIDGSHAVIGADFAKKHGESEAVCHAIRSHHEDEKPNSVYAFLCQAADAASGARPGARRQNTESYVKRLEDLESIGNSFEGVLRTFALQAGREVRVLVEGAKVTDEQAVMLSRDIARKIEREMAFPGQIKITVIRETRAVEHAR